MLSIASLTKCTDTLQANLSSVVATACHTSSHSPKARADIANADVIVATHGTTLDLLRHYPDVLSMSNVRAGSYLQICFVIICALILLFTYDFCKGGFVSDG